MNGEKRYFLDKRRPTADEGGGGLRASDGRRGLAFRGQPARALC